MVNNQNQAFAPVIAAHGGEQVSPAATQSLVSGQHTSLLLQLDASVQKTPGLVGLRQALASGQQYVPESAQGVWQSAPGLTQILVSGQHTSPSPHAVASALQLVLVGVRHFLASGQQYSVALHVLAVAVAVAFTCGFERSQPRVEDVQPRTVTSLFFALHWPALAPHTGAFVGQHVSESPGHPTG